VLKVTNEIGNAAEKHFSIDGTGDPCTMKVNYESKQSEQRKNKQAKTNKGPSDAFPGKSMISNTRCSPFAQQLR
jgi:hypothetical protein